MKKLLLALLVGLGFTVALAFEVPPNSQLLITDDSGRVVGEGKIEDDEAELDLLVGFEGSATLTVTAPDGTVQAYFVEVEADGSVTITEVDGSSEFGSTLRERGFEVDIERDDSVGRSDDADDGQDDGDDDRNGDEDDGDEDNSGPGSDDDDDRDEDGNDDQDDNDSDDDSDDDDDQDDDDEDDDNSGHGGDDDGEED